MPEPWQIAPAADEVPSRLLGLSRYVVQIADLNPEHARGMIQLKTGDHFLIHKLKVVMNRSHCIPSCVSYTLKMSSILLRTARE